MKTSQNRWKIEKIDNIEHKPNQSCKPIYGFMRLLPRRNNPNKETLVYIPLSHVVVIRVCTTRIAK